MTSIFEGQPPKTRPFPIKTRVIWVPGKYTYPKNAPCMEYVTYLLLQLVVYVCMYVKYSTTWSIFARVYFFSEVHLECQPKQETDLTFHLTLCLWGWWILLGFITIYINWTNYVQSELSIPVSCSYWVTQFLDEPRIHSIRCFRNPFELI